MSVGESESECESGKVSERESGRVSVILKVNE